MNAWHKGRVAGTLLVLCLRRRALSEQTSGEQSVIGVALFAV